MRRFFFVSSFAAVVLVACGGTTSSAIPDGNTSGQKLLTQQDGSPTISGGRCSWAGTGLLTGVVVKDPPPTHAVGESFTSLDGCNQCSCTAQGIACTTNTCGGSGGTSSGQQGCTTEAMVCPDGTAVGRTGPNCSFAPCPGMGAIDAGRACPDIAKACPDGSYVGASGPNCEFVCPTLSCEQLADAARKEVDSAIQAHASCNGDEDCTNISYATKCFSSCTRGVNKTGIADVDSAKTRANANQCAQFETQNCKLLVPPCVAPQAPHCSGHICQ